jgi:hypothetical protein
MKPMALERSSKKRRHQGRALLTAADGLIQALRTNEWPLDAKTRPFTCLGVTDGWTSLSEQEAKADPERARKIELGKEGERLCEEWRARVRGFLLDCRRFVNDWGDAEERGRFESNMLAELLVSGDSMAFEMYQTPLCLRDLESLATLVSRIGAVRRPAAKKAGKKSRFGSDLRRARNAYGDSQTAAGATIGTTQSEISMYETGKRKPRGPTLAACKDYIKNTPKEAAPENVSSPAIKHARTAQ